MAAVSDSFYKAFEDRYRGARGQIKSRLEMYLPFVEPLKDLHEVCSVLDLGCGRGEWLERLEENGIHAHGVDLDEEMLGDCRERNLEVQHDDAVAYLRRLHDESLSVVSGFHIAEHLPFSKLGELVSEALRVLKPAGLLILETPNPENLVVGANSFYLDPTHERPLPPGLLSFLAEHAGFERVKIVRVNEAEYQGLDSPVSLATILNGVSPDYSIVAQKAALPETLRGFDPLFEAQYGVTLDAIVARYEESVTHRFEKIEESVTHRIEKREQDLEFERKKRDEVEQELTAVYASMSWRITWPLRQLMQCSQRLVRLAGSGVVRLIRIPPRITRALLTRVSVFIGSHPALETRLVRTFDHCPQLRDYLREFVGSPGSRKGQTVASQSEFAASRSAGECPTYLSEDASRIFADLKNGIDRKSY